LDLGWVLKIQDWIWFVKYDSLLITAYEQRWLVTFSESNSAHVPKLLNPDPGPVSSEISDLCEISDLFLFFSYFASQNKEITSGNSFDV